MPENEQPRMVSAFEHENALMHYGRVNKRSMITTIAVCLTFIIVTAIFVCAYTVREQHWIDAFHDLIIRQEVSNEESTETLP